MFVLTLLLMAGTADRVVAVVDMEPVLASDVEASVVTGTVLNPVARDADRDSLWNSYLDYIINQKLILKKAARDTTIIVNRDEIEENVERQLDLIYRYLDTLPAEKARLEEAGVTREKLSRILVDEGRFQSAFQQMLAMQGKYDPYVSPTQVKEYYEEVKDSLGVVPGYFQIAHIAISLQPSQAAQQAAGRKIMEVMDILGRGGDFEVVAGSFSEDPQGAAHGGLLGWVSRGQMLPEIDTVLFTLPAGQLSPPVVARDGYHLFLVERKTQDKVYAREIFFKLRISREDTLQALSSASRIRQAITSGELTFAQAAQEYSEDYTTREQGGFLGAGPLSQELPPPFDSLIAVLDSGEVSQPLVAEGAVELIYMMDKKPDRTLTFEEMQPQIRDLLAALKREEWLMDMIDEAKKEFYVEKNL